MEEKCTSIVLNNTISALNSWKTWQLHLKLICPKWVYKTKHNPDRSTQYKAWLGINKYEQTDFSETYATIENLTTFRYVISLMGKFGTGWNMDH